MKRIVMIALAIVLIMIAALASYMMFRPQLQSTSPPESSTPQETPKPTPEEQGITPKQVLEMVYAELQMPVNFTGTQTLNLTSLIGKEITIIGNPRAWPGSDKPILLTATDEFRSWSVKYDSKIEQREGFGVLIHIIMENPIDHEKIWRKSIGGEGPLIIFKGKVIKAFMYPELRWELTLNAKYCVEIYILASTYQQVE